MCQSYWYHGDIIPRPQILFLAANASPQINNYLRSKLLRLGLNNCFCGGLWVGKSPERPGEACPDRDGQSARPPQPPSSLSSNSRKWAGGEQQQEVRGVRRRKWGGGQWGERGSQQEGRGRWWRGLELIWLESKTSYQLTLLGWLIREAKNNIKISVLLDKINVKHWNIYIEGYKLVRTG